jgi:hypothetical protein
MSAFDPKRTSKAPSSVDCPLRLKVLKSYTSFLQQKWGGGNNAIATISMRNIVVDDRAWLRLGRIR